MAQSVHFSAVVGAVERHGPDVATFRLSADRVLPRFVPGQFIHLALDPYDRASFWPESRIFSVANAVTDRRTVQLTISRQGRYTSRILDELRPGDHVSAKGPYGDFRIDDRQGLGHAVLIAGGTGITPFSAVMDLAIVTGRLPVERVSLYYGARSPDLLLYRSVADACTDRVPTFSVQYYAERGAAGDVRAGSLDIDQIVEQTDDPAAVYFLSGPKAMIDNFQQRLIAQGIPSQQIVIDAWE